jgi:hypothetical protein
MPDQIQTFGPMQIPRQFSMQQTLMQVRQLVVKNLVAHTDLVHSQ